MEKFRPRLMPREFGPAWPVGCWEELIRLWEKIQIEKGNWPHPIFYIMEIKVGGKK